MSATDSRTGRAAPALRVADVDVGFVDVRRQVADDVLVDDALADEPKWPAWKVTVAVVVFCGSFWSGIGYLAVRLFG